MRTILIVFATLLLLLTLLSAFGGSMKQNEPFYDGIAINERFTDSMATVPPSQPGKSVADKAKEAIENAKKALTGQSKAPVPSSVKPVYAESKSKFTEEPNVSIFPPEALKSPEYFEEGFAIQPFEDETQGSVPASF